MSELSLRSGLADEIRALVSEKNSLGYPYVQSARHLVAFDAMCAELYPGESSLTREMAMAWAERRDGEHPNTQTRRISPVRALAERMSRNGTDAFVIPRGVPAHEVDYVPYIYTREEVGALIGAADAMASTARGSREACLHTWPQIFRDSQTLVMLKSILVLLNSRIVFESPPARKALTLDRSYLV